MFDDSPAERLTQDCDAQDGPPFQLRVVAAEGAMGSGVRAEELIPKGSAVCEYTGELIRGQEMKVREKVGRSHSPGP